MKKIIFILLILLPINLLAQKMIIIPDRQQKPFQKVLITWHDGIEDAFETAMDAFGIGVI